MMNSNPIKRCADLRSYQVEYKLSGEIYRISKIFLREETYSLNN